MTKFKHFETESGKITKTAQFDGYSIAERLLEGLMFQVTVQEDGTLKTYLKKEDEDWFSQFNVEKWMKEAEEHSYKNDIFEDPISGEDCWLVVDGEDDRFSSKKSTPIAIKTTSAADIANIFGKKSTAQSQATQTDVETIEAEEVKEKIIGKFKPKRKFLNFVSGIRRGNIRLITDVAFIKSEQFTGQIEGTIFKVTICDEGTINFEETDTKLCDDVMIQRFIDDIDNRDVTGYSHKYVVAGLEFQTKDAEKAYLEVDEAKPINKLFNLFDEIEKEKEMKPISEKGMSILDSLFSDDELNETTPVEENVVDVVVKTEEKEPSKETYSQQMFREAFESMNAEKVTELTERIEKTEKSIVKSKFDIKTAESNLEKETDNLRVLQTRLESMSKADEPNGYVFYVSVENKTGIELDANIKEAVMKISPILKLREKVIIEMITQGYNTIKITKKGDIKSEDFVLDKEVYKKLMKLDVTGKLTMVGTAEFEYRGELTWHQLVARMIRLGFEQDPEFDKLCGSNSYENEKVEEVIEDEDHKHSDACGCGDNKCETKNENMKNINEFKTKTLMSFKTPTDIVILGADHEGRDIEITDDYSDLHVYTDGKFDFSMETEGHVSVLTIDKYKEWVSESPSKGSIDALIVAGFVGDIGVGVKLKDGSYVTDFDENDYIQHQLDDEWAQVFINFPKGTQMFEIKNHDLNSVVPFMRDKKIGSVLETKNESKLKKFENFNQDEYDEDEAEGGNAMEEEFLEDDFVFAILHEPTASNDIMYPQATIAITPKSHWDSEGYQYDGELDWVVRQKYPTLGAMGDQLEELGGGVFIMSNFNGKNLNTCVALGINDVVEKLCKAGVMFSFGFQDYMSQKDTQIVSGIVTQLGYNNLKTK